MAKRILMICYYYPPLLDVGCKRSVGFSKYFKQHGWLPYVLSIKNPDKTYCITGNDFPPHGVFTKYSYSVINPYRFAGKVNGLFTRIMRVFHVEIRRNYFRDLLCIPDLFWGWIPLAVADGLKIIRQRAIDLIYVSCPPFSGGLIGIILKSLVKRPLCLDFRDPYALEKLRFANLTTFRKKIDAKIEKWLLTKTDILVVTSEDMRREYVLRYPDLKKKIFTVHNGVDVEPVNIILPESKYDKFTIVYAGLYFYSAYEWDPNFFFEALAILSSKGIINAKNFQFLFYGEGQKQVAEIAKTFGVKDIVIAHPRLDYSSIIQIIRRSHLQLLRNRNLVIPSKLYDGIALNVPFLATIPGGEAELIIRKYSPDSYIITKESASDVAAAICDAIEKYKRKFRFENDVSGFFKQFSREHLSFKLMKILEENASRKTVSD